MKKELKRILYVVIVLGALFYVYVYFFKNTGNGVVTNNPTVNVNQNVNSDVVFSGDPGKEKIYTDATNGFSLTLPKNLEVIQKDFVIYQTADKSWAVSISFLVQPGVRAEDYIKNNLGRPIERLQTQNFTADLVETSGGAYPARSAFIPHNNGFVVVESREYSENFIHDEALKQIVRSLMKL